jgi:hypothetical protein
MAKNIFFFHHFCNILVAHLSHRIKVKDSGTATTTSHQERENGKVLSFLTMVVT